MKRKEIIRRLIAEAEEQGQVYGGYARGIRQGLLMAIEYLEGACDE